CPLHAGSQVRRFLFPLSVPALPATYLLSLHDALPILPRGDRRGSAHERDGGAGQPDRRCAVCRGRPTDPGAGRRGGSLNIWNWRSEEHTSELQSRVDLVCRLLLDKKKDVTESGVS